MRHSIILFRPRKKDCVGHLEDIRRRNSSILHFSINSQLCWWSTQDTGALVVLLYDRTSTEEKINEAPKQLFSQKGRPMDGLPPTQAALVEHVKRAAYQAGHVWAQMFVAVPKLPSPSEWGWLQTIEGGWEVKWTTLPEAFQACREFLRCLCKTSQCKCVKASLQCTGLCFCRGLCDREWLGWCCVHVALLAVLFLDTAVIWCA